MAPLRSLQPDFPVVDSEFQSFCSSLGIFTVEDFLIHDLNSLNAIVEKQLNAARLKEGFDQILSIIDGLHRPWLNGLELLKDCQQNKQISIVQCKGMELFRCGILRQGFVTELVGPSSSGKTQVCLQAAASFAEGNAGAVLFLDSGNSFSARRVAHLVSLASCAASLEENHAILHKVMSNISCVPVFDIFTLLDLLHQLESKLKIQMQNGECVVQLLVLDSFSALITPVLGGGPNGHALMTSTGYLLKMIAHEYNLCILVTNHMVGGEGGVQKPALGESWKSIPHVRVLVAHDRESNIRTLSILKHPSLAPGRVLDFKVSHVF